MATTLPFFNAQGPSTSSSQQNDFFWPLLSEDFANPAVGGDQTSVADCLWDMDIANLISFSPSAFAPPLHHDGIEASALFSRDSQSPLTDDSSSDSGVSAHDEQRARSAGPQKRLRGAAAFLHSLTPEEKTAFAAEGVTLPHESFVLTKAEERVLKQLRRKIRNKLSAQESRLKKKEYVTGLEDRVQNCTTINMELQQKVQNLEESNRTLLQQLQALQAYVLRTNAGRAGTGTTLMLVALCCALFFPAMGTRTLAPNNAFTPTGFQSRTLQQDMGGLEANGNSSENGGGAWHVVSLWLNFKDIPFDWPSVSSTGMQRETPLSLSR